MIQNLETHRNPFTDRREVLERIRQAFEGNGARAVMLHGPPGTGKTATVVKAVEHLKKYFDFIYAFDCRGGLHVEEMLLDLCGFFRQQDVGEFENIIRSTMPLDLKLDFFAQILSRIRLLLIMDSFEHLLKQEGTAHRIAHETMKKGLSLFLNQCAEGTRFLFSSDKGFVLIDSGLGGQELIEDIELRGFSQDEAEIFLKGLREYKDGLEIFRITGGHPFTLQLFARIAETIPVDDLLAGLKGLEGKKATYAIVEKAYDGLSDSAKTLLVAASAFHKAVSREGLASLLKETGTDIVVEKSLEELIALGMVTTVRGKNIPGYLVHAVAKEFIKENHAPDEWKRKLSAAALYHENVARTTGAVWHMVNAHTLLVEAGEYKRAGKLATEISGPLQKWGLTELARSMNQMTVETAEGTEKAAALGALGNMRYAEGQHREAVDTFRRSARISEESGDKEGALSALYQIAVISQEQGGHEAAEENYSQGLEIARNSGNSQFAARILTNMGTIQRQRGQYAESVNTITESMEIFKELGEREGVAHTLYNLGVTYLDKGSPETATDYFQQCLEIFTELGHHSGISQARHRLGLAYQAMGNLDRAEEEYVKCLKAARDSEDREGLARNLLQMGLIHRQRGSLEKALEHFNQCLSVFAELKDSQGMAACLRSTGDVCLDKGEYDKAIEAFGQSLKMEEAAGNKTDIARTLGRLGLAFLEKRDYRPAVWNLLISLSIFEHLESPHRRLVLQDLDRVEKALGREEFRILYEEVMAEFRSKEK